MITPAMMVELPWQVIASLVGLLALQMILQHLRRIDTRDRIELAVREAKRAERADYRKTYLAAIADAKCDMSEGKT